MMANTLLLALGVFLILAPNLGMSCCCTSDSGRFMSFDITDNTEIYPIFNPTTGTVGVMFQVNFRKREAPLVQVPPSKRTLFTHLDLNKNGEIQLEEWVATKGQTENFTEFLKADDTNGDAEISWEEFKQVSQVIFNQDRD